MKRILFAGSLLLMLTLSKGQEIKFIDFRKLETKDGLCSPNIRKIVQDKFGFVWFATQEGLSRFDGLTFINFKSGLSIKDRSLLSSDVFDLAIDAAGSYLWALTTYGGLNKIDLKTLQVVARFPLNNVSGKHAALWFTKMVLVGGKFYIATNEGLVIVFNPASGATEKVYEATFSDQGILNIEALVYSGNQLWIFGYGGKVIIQDPLFKKAPSFLSIRETSAEFHFRSAALLNDRYAALITNFGVRILDLQHRTILPAPGVLSRSLLPCFREDMYAISVNDKHIYLAGVPGLFKVDKLTGSVEKLLPSRTPADRDWFSSSAAIFESGSSLFLGSPLGVAYIKNLHSPFTAFSTSYHDGLTKIGHSIHLFPYNDSILYSGANESAYSINLNTSRIDKIGKNELYFALFKGPEGRLFASRMAGTDIISDPENKSYPVSTYYPELKQLNTDAFISYLNYKDSLYFFASQNQNGLYIWDWKNRHVEVITAGTRPVALTSNVINRIYRDNNDNVWIICDNAVSVYSIKNKTIRHLNTVNPETNQPLSIIMDMCEQGGRKYLAVYGMGIVVLDEKDKVIKTISLKDGLNNLGLYKIFPFGDTMLIASSNDGLAVLDVKRNKASMYYVDDGLQSNSFEETSGNVFGKFLFMGGIDGFTRIDPSRFSQNDIPPRCYFSGVNILSDTGANNFFNLFPGEIRIPNNSTQTTIYFSALNYVSPEKIKYSYKISGVNEKWISLNAQSFINLIGISPGAYELEVKAANEDNVWSEPISLTLLFLPKWYQTWWFKSIIALLIIGLLYGLYRYRLSQIKKEQQIRQRIASDLHDDIGSTLNSIKVFANLSLMKPENNTAYLVQLKEGVQSAIVGVRDMVWVLDDKQDTFSHLVQRVEQFISPLASAQDIDFEKSLEVSLSDSVLQKEEKRNLYLIIKEAFNNSVKYSGATSLQLQIKKALYDKYVIVIRDNGKGFDISTIKNGNGLNNLRYRAAQIKYSIDISSSPGNGTVITLHKS